MCYDMIWYYMIWYMIWYDTIWYDMIRYDTMIWYDMTWYTIWYDRLYMIWYISLQLGSHPVAVVQYTYTHKQYRERHKTNNTQNNTKIHRPQKIIEQHKTWEECGPCPVFAGFTLAFALQLRKKHGKTSVIVVIHKHKMRLHSHNNKNT